MAYQHSENTNFRLTIFRLVFITLLLAFNISAQSEEQQSAEKVESFDHFTTGFPLTGRHEFIDCSSCHLGGQFKGTPMECGLCHNDSRAPGKHPQHFPSSIFCDNCHTDNTWTNARFDHSDFNGACESCHNGITAIGKSPDHILSTQACEDCHNTIVFDRVSRVDHAAVMGVCTSCHNGVIAVGKHPTHVQTTSECDACHTTATWLGAGFDHTNITGLCSSCHNGSTATGKDASHFITTEDCDRCHTTAGWLQMVTFLHSSPNYPGDHRTATQCEDCHTTNNQDIAWPFSLYKPDCAGCHANDFKPDSHKGPGDVLIPIIDVQDCSGLCHLKDGDESGEHSAGGAEW